MCRRFWFYSMQFEKDNRDIVIHQFDYGSIMNVVANLPNLVQQVYRRFAGPNDGKKKSEQIRGTTFPLDPSFVL